MPLSLRLVCPSISARRVEVMRRLICAVTVVLVALGAVVGAAFAKQEHPGSSKTVTVSYFTFSAAPDHLNTLKELIQIFEKKNPNIKISFQTAPYSDYFTKLQTQIAGGQAPDTFELDYGSFYGYATSGSLLNLSKVAKTDPTFNPGIYYPKAYSAFAVGKTQFGLPESYSDVLLFYNKDLFRAAGVPFPTAKWTWKDELAAAKKLTNASKGVYGDFQPIQFYEFYKVLAQNGGVADAAMCKLGKLAMWHNGLWQLTARKDAPFQWDVGVEPAGKVKAN